MCLLSCNVAVISPGHVANSRPHLCLPYFPACDEMYQAVPVFLLLFCEGVGMGLVSERVCVCMIVCLCED